jgi:tRNA(fMet)-specific endonuclease VapC
VARLILDTTVLVTSERRRTSIGELIDDEDDVAIAAVSAAELMAGVELADRRRRRRRETFVATILEALPVEPYDRRVAHAHASLLAHVRRAGPPRGAHELIVAATAVASDRVIVTRDTRPLEGLPRVRVR